MKSFLKINLIFIFIFELIFQLLIFFNFKFIKIPDLFYNGYCDQRYWNFNNKKTIFKTATNYHPILSFVKKNITIPKKIPNKDIKNKNDIKSNTISLYGSSYINHDQFKNILSKKDVSFNNYALDSYGLDQIYLSYKLTAHLNQNSTAIIGFLLEDLDRSIFYKREYQKAQFKKINNSFELKNVPVDLNKVEPQTIDFYLFKFLKNFFTLAINNFDPRSNECHLNLKKELFSFYVDDILKIAERNNQKIIFITFNLKEDLLNKPTWRYLAIKEYISVANITHVDSYELLKNKSLNKKDIINNFFGNDKHNNRKSFSYIVEELFKKL